MVDFERFITFGFAETSVSIYCPAIAESWLGGPDDMDINTIYIVTIAVCVSTCFGFFLHRFIALREKGKTDGQGSGGYMLMSNACRNTLHMLESGDIDGAKRFLSFAVANFYHSFRSTNERDGAIAIERRQIEEQAQSSSILADALRKRMEADTKPVA